MSAQNAINEAVEDVISMMNETAVFFPVRRGALTIGNSISCEVGPSAPLSHYLNKDVYVPVDLTLNGKHADLRTVTEAMNEIHYNLKRRSLSGPGGRLWTSRMPQCPASSGAKTTTIGCWPHR